MSTPLFGVESMSPSVAPVTSAQFRVSPPDGLMETLKVRVAEADTASEPTFQTGWAYAPCVTVTAFINTRPAGRKSVTTTFVAVT